MGEISPPTAADYAWSAAQRAGEATGSLQRQITDLTWRVARLERVLTEMLGSLPMLWIEDEPPKLQGVRFLDADGNEIPQ